MYSHFTPLPTWMPADSHQFPNVERALTEPDGLLALGGNLNPDSLLTAYAQGIFPWFNEGEPIMWWSPNPRAVLFPDKLKISRSLSKTLKKQAFTISFDRAFSDVISACSSPRTDQPNADPTQSDSSGTWITPIMQDAYQQLHKAGHAHSVEVWQDNTLVGGLYGVAIGKVFFGESMFHRVSDASKIAFVHLVRQLTLWGFELIDCQVTTQHLLSLGAEEIPRKEFCKLLDHLCPQTGQAGIWTITPR